MSTPWAIFAFIVILAFLIFIHELGHFATAKWRGVKVLEFGMGMPPRIFGVQRGETMYSINWIPLGGFCKMLGEEDPSEERSLARQGIGTRILVLSAGSLMMFLFPIILFTIVYLVPHDVVVGGEGIQIKHMVIDTPAHVAGAEPGDEILSIDGEPVKTFDELREAVNPKLGSEITMLVRRDAGTTVLKMIPREEWPAGQGPLGIGIGYVTTFTEKESYPPWEAIYYGARQSWQMVVALKDGIAAAIAGEVPFTPTSIIGIGQATSEIAKAGILQLLAWAGFLSINLGIVNLLPIPALDGGRIAFVFLELIRRGKRVSPKYEGMAHLIGFALLIALMMIISYYDVLRIMRGESLFP